MPTRAALLGAGRMGRRHLAVLRELGVEIAAVADPSDDSLRETAREHGVPDAALHRDAQAALASRPELVVIASTAPSHAPLTLAAAAAGARFILCEKPMASSLGECDAMIAACRDARLAVNHQMRHIDEYREARQLLADPALGGWTGMTVVGGNMGLAMCGTHYFELFRWLTGEPAHEVTAWFDAAPVPSPRGPTFHDRSGQVRVTTRSGKRLYLDFGGDQGHGARITYAGRWGIVSIDQMNGRFDVSTRRPEHRDLPTTRYGMPSEERSVAVPATSDLMLPTRRTVEALLAGGDFPTGEDGRHALAVLVAAHVSAERGGAAVRVDDELPRERTFDHA
jgi:myo-inositol 2-dehydrogenase / D-chiro-inositol 1-dehydrogenase